MYSLTEWYFFHVNDNIILIFGGVLWFIDKVLGFVSNSTWEKTICILFARKKLDYLELGSIIAETIEYRNEWWRRIHVDNWHLSVHLPEPNPLRLSFDIIFVVAQVGLHYCFVCPFLYRNINEPECGSSYANEFVEPWVMGICGFWNVLVIISFPPISGLIVSCAQQFSCMFGLFTWFTCIYRCILIKPDTLMCAGELWTSTA